MTDDKVRIFIGTSANGEDAEIEAAYRYTLEKNSSLPVDITWMRQNLDIKDPYGCWGSTRHWSTPFSGFRWTIPEMCNFEGRAIYTDCDMLNFKDIVELLNVDLKGKAIGARRGQRFGGHEFCVMVFDCEKFKDDVLVPITRQKLLPEYHHRCIQFFSGNEEWVADIDPRWNCLDGENYAVDEIWHLHYTRMRSQPWKPEWFVGETCEHRRPEIAQLFWDTLAEAEEAGYIPFKPNIPPVKYNISVHVGD